MKNRKLLPILLVIVMVLPAVLGATVFAFAETTYTVTFDMGSTEVAQIPQQQVASGSTIADVGTPVWEGHTFIGWFDSETRVNLVDVATLQITEDTTLYAGWVTTREIKEPTLEGWTEVTADSTGYRADQSSGLRLAIGTTSSYGVTDLFLGNNYIELGMHRNGAFGSYVAAPSNFHPGTSWSYSGNIGLRSSKTGWGTGTDKDGTYTRDFFLPGAIDEGWLITENGSDAAKGQYGTGGYYMNGQNLETSDLYYKVDDGVLYVKAVITTTAGYEITQTIILAENDTGYDTWVDIKNTTDSKKNTVTYYRAFDPDQPGYDGPLKESYATSGYSSYDDYYDDYCYTTDNFYYTDENGDVYAVASSKDTGISSPSTLSKIFAKADGSIYYWAPSSLVRDSSGNRVYTAYPVTQDVGWYSSSDFSKVDGSTEWYPNGYHEYADTGMGIRLDLGDIDAGATKSLYYYTSLDPDTSRSTSKLIAKSQGKTTIPDAPEFELSEDETQLSVSADEPGRVYLVDKMCMSFEEVADPANQVVPGQKYDGTNDVVFDLEDVPGGEYYLYFVDEEGVLSAYTPVSYNVITSIDPLPSYEYTGSEIMPKVTAYSGSKKLTEGVDYTLSYANNINVGSAQAVVTGTGKYGGEASVNFAITAKAITITSASAVKIFDGTELTAQELIIDGTIAEQDTYSLKWYSSQTAVGSCQNDYYFSFNDWRDRYYNYNVTYKYGTLVVLDPAGEDLTADPNDIKKVEDILSGKYPGSTVRVYMVIDRNVTNAQKKAFSAVTEGRTATYYNANIYAEVDGETRDIGYLNTVPIAVYTDFDANNNIGLKVYRLHDGEVAELTTTPNEDGEFFYFDEPNNKLIVVSMRYSTFSVTWQGVPSTGDETNLWLLTGLVAVSVIGMTVIAIARKKRRG